MKNFLKVLMISTILAFGVTACSKVPAGNVGVKVYLLGKSKGVDSEELGPGRYWIGINEDLFLFPTFTQNYVWTAENDEGSPNDESITYQSREGMTVSADIGISYSIKPEKVNTVFQKYRRGVDEITDTYLRNMVRDAFVSEASTKPITQIYGEGKEDIIQAVQERVQRQTEEIGINIEKIYYIGSLRLPDEVKSAISSKINADQIAQQKRNEVAQAQADAEKEVAKAKGDAAAILERANAQAEANRKIAESLTPNLIQYEFAKKWNGISPVYMSGSGQSPIPFVNATQEQK